MQREDKQLELVLENFQSKLNEFKGQIYALIFKLEHERDNVSWTTVLDTFAVFSTQYTAIMKYLSYEKLPQLRNYSVLPLMLNPERDEELARITENRVPALSHDIVPDFLRTKTEPEVEHKLMQVKTIFIECIYYLFIYFYTNYGTRTLGGRTQIQLTSADTVLRVTTLLFSATLYSVVYPRAGIQ